MHAIYINMSIHYRAGSSSIILKEFILRIIVIIDQAKIKNNFAEQRICNCPIGKATLYNCFKVLYQIWTTDHTKFTKKKGRISEGRLHICGFRHWNGVISSAESNDNLILCVEYFQIKTRMIIWGIIKGFRFKTNLQHVPIK